jgi:hypothetical protein
VAVRCCERDSSVAPMEAHWKGSLTFAARGLACCSPRQLLLSRRFASSLACKVAGAAQDVG